VEVFRSLRLAFEAGKQGGNATTAFNAANEEAIARVKDAGVPIVNYGIFIAATQGILKRTLEPFEEASRILNEI